MAKDNEVIRGLKKKFNKSLADLQRKYPEITFRPRSADPNGTKANDICVEVDGKIAVVLHADDNYPNGVIFTDIVSAEDKNRAILIEGRAADPEPGTIYSKYRHRPKWTTGTRWVRCFDSYDKFLFEIETIVCRALGVAIPKNDKGINTPIPPKAMSADGFVVVCPRCEGKFQHAERCPECGQLILYGDIDNSNDDIVFSIREIEALYEQYGISYKQVKGDYCIMGGKNGSSLNLNKNGYVIYTTDYDYKNIVSANIAATDLKLEKNANLRDGVRPNTVRCFKQSTLKSLMGIYAKNADYRV